MSGLCATVNLRQRLPGRSLYALLLLSGAAHAQVVFKEPGGPPVPVTPEPRAAAAGAVAPMAATPFLPRDPGADAIDLEALTPEALGPLPDLPPPEEMPAANLGDPIVIPPVVAPDAVLTSPLPPLSTFDATPLEGLEFKREAQARLRYTLKVEGLGPTGTEGTFHRMSALRRGESKDATPAQIASRTNSDKALMQRLMFSEGFYDGVADSDINLEAEGKASILLTATPGARYSWRQITLDLIPANKPELAEGFGLQVGDPIRAIEVEEAEGALLKRLLESGYPFAEIGARDVVLDQGGPTGTYFLTGDIGPEGVFGPITLKGFQPFDVEHANVIARFEPGDSFNTSLVDDFRRALIATQQFGGVTVATVDTGQRDAEGRAITEIQVIGNRGPLRQLIGQVGYSTGEGFRAEALWRHRALIRPEGMFTARAVVGTQEQRAAAQLTFGNWGQRDRTLDLGFDVAHLNRPAYEATQATIGAHLKRTSTPIWQKLWTWSLGFELVASREREDVLILPVNTLQRDFLIAALPMSIGYDRSNDLLDPTKGFRLGLAISPEISRQGGEMSTYARIQGDATYYHPFGEKFVLAGRGRVGSIIGADTANVAPTRRFFAGGGGSVRGFDYQSIGPVNSAGDPAGGRGLTEVSIEGRYRMGTFGFVAFVDAGTVNDGPTPTLSNIRYGAGVGVRYYTSFGPLRADIARAINRGPHDPPVAIYISIGQAF